MCMLIRLVHAVIIATMNVLIALAALVACSLAADIKECQPQADKTGCDDTECCIPEMEFFKVGKREELLKQVFPWGNRRGRCVKYWTEGENCYSMSRWQKCGCAQGLRCHYTPAPEELLPNKINQDDLIPLSKRAIPPQFRPKGKHACVVDE